MSMPLAEYEWEALPEYEYEGEYESEEFFRRVGSLARRAARSPMLRRVGLAVARAQLRGLGDVGGAIGSRWGPRGAALGRDLGSVAGRHLSGMLPQREYEGEYEWELEGEYEWEFEDEYEAEVNPQRRAYPEALMEHLGHAAAATPSAAEAEAFIGALVPLAARLLPRAAPAIMRATPQLVRGLANATRALHRSPSTRPLIRTLPTIVRRTAATIGRQRGLPPQQAVQTLARQTYRTISSPQAAVQAYRRSRALDRCYHQQAAR